MKKWFDYNCASLLSYLTNTTLTITDTSVACAKQGDSETMCDVWADVVLSCVMFIHSDK